MENFEQLRKLLTLKRHEQPPPGYFHNFSREVIVRIKAGESGETAVSAWWAWEGSWLQRVWGAFEARPVVAGAFGVAVCGFFVAGALISTDSLEAGSFAVTTGEPQAATMPTQLAVSTPSEHVAEVALPNMTPAAAAASSTDGSLFQQLQQMQQQRPVSSLVGYEGAQPTPQNVLFSPSGK